MLYIYDKVRYIYIYSIYIYIYTCYIYTCYIYMIQYIYDYLC